jgi:hypothetical protein
MNGPAGMNLDLSATLPRISCRDWWRWQDSCGFP